MPISNSARSGGPATPGGRAVTAQNALKTGAYATQVVLPGEDATQFDALKAQLEQDFEPVGMAEAAMVHDLAVLTWKKLRVDRVEHSTMMQMVQLPLLQDAVEKSYGPGLLPAALARLVPSFEPVDQDECDEATTLVAQVEAVQAAPASQRKLPTLRRKWPELYDELQSWGDDLEIEVDEVIEGATADGYDLDALLNNVLESRQTVMWLWENREAVRAAVQRVRDGRMLLYMKTTNTQRAYEDTGRAFYRTLAELRKQQDWRMRRTAITVDEVSPRLPQPPLDEAAAAPT